MSDTQTKTDQETISVYNNQAEGYAKLTEDSTNESLLTFISKLGAEAFVLDLGCGPANASATMREHGLRVDPVDASSEMVRLANEKHDIGARQASFAEIDSIDSYDGIWASFCLLHAKRADFAPILTALHAALKNKGWFYITMKLGEGEARDKLGRFYTYYSQEDLTSHLTKTGFTLEEIKTGEAISLAGNVDPWIMFLCQKS